MKPKEWDLSGKNALVTVGGDFISSSSIRRSRCKCVYTQF